MSKRLFKPSVCQYCFFHLSVRFRCGCVTLLFFLPSLCRYIRSERSIILVNFCFSILASNLLILAGQSQTISKVKRLVKHTHILYSCTLLGTLKCISVFTSVSYNWLVFSHKPFITLLVYNHISISGPLCCDRCLLALLLLGLLLLGVDRGVAVLPGRDWKDQVKDHTQALPVPRLG